MLSGRGDNSAIDPEVLPQNLCKSVVMVDNLSTGKMAGEKLVSDHVGAGEMAQRLLLGKADHVSSVCESHIELQGRTDWGTFLWSPHPATACFQ